MTAAQALEQLIAKWRRIEAQHEAVADKVCLATAYAHRACADDLEAVLPSLALTHRPVELSEADYDETVDIALKVVAEIGATMSGAAGYLSAVLQNERKRERSLALPEPEKALLHCGCESGQPHKSTCPTIHGSIADHYGHGWIAGRQSRAALPAPEKAQQTIKELDLKWAAASEFIRDIFEALGKPQPSEEAIVNLPELAMQVVGQIEELKVLAAALPAPPPEKAERPPCGWEGKHRIVWNVCLDAGMTLPEADEFTGSPLALNLILALAASSDPSPAQPEKPLLSCCQPAPNDRYGRRCDKPRGHDGDHWTYAGDTLTWPASPAQEKP